MGPPAGTLLSTSRSLTICAVHNHWGFVVGIAYGDSDYARLTLEALTVVGVIIYMVLAFRNLYFTGKQRFIEILKVIHWLP